MDARTNGRLLGLVTALTMSSALAVAAPAEAKPTWTKPQQVAPRDVPVGFPGDVAVGERGRSLLVFSCDRGTSERPRWFRCARWRDRDGTLRPIVTLEQSPDRYEDAVLEAVVSRRGVGTVVWPSARGLELRRVSPTGRVGGGRLLTTERPTDVSLVAGADGTVAVGWHSTTTGAQLRVIAAGGGLGPARTLPGTHVRAISPSSAGGYAVLTTTGSPAPDQSGGEETVHSRLTVSKVDGRGSVRSSALVADRAAKGDVAMLPGGTTVVVWWKQVADRSVLTERRYAGSVDGASATRALLAPRRRGSSADLVVAPGGRVYLGWQAADGTYVGLLPRRPGGELRWANVPGYRTDLEGMLHAGRGQVVLVSQTRSEAGKWLGFRTWDGTGPASSERRVLDDYADYSPDGTLTRYAVASAGGYLAALNISDHAVGRGEVVYRD
ncbi:hypothetical protein QWY28_09345 [Nocardioides sp. SOB77]|uniref:WD40 repeat domain-containing protein n=1 Tax=Nocardioides oceani TaxID=3058369 RepID=A0ABT8FFH0_9ACTN|nr:hypothetical protein [Nocardioides oceani]MDN4173145.1 hypothetical protein [Nocardioides oceani]